MAMTVSTSGIGELEKMLGKLADKTQEIASKAMYKGAGVMADGYTKGIDSIKTEPFHYVAMPEVIGKRYASPEEKAALIGKTGIAKFQKDTDSVNTLVGIGPNAGYADVAGKQKAVPLVARSINSGTSFMHKQPVIRKAISSSRKAAKAEIVAEAEKLIDEIMQQK